MWKEGREEGKREGIKEGGKEERRERRKGGYKKRQGRKEGWVGVTARWLSFYVTWASKLIFKLNFGMVILKKLITSNFYVKRKRKERGREGERTEGSRERRNERERGR